MFSTKKKKKNPQKKTKQTNKQKKTTHIVKGKYSRSSVQLRLTKYSLHTLCQICD